MVPVSQPNVAPPAHAPNAALLIDFDNVTMGIRSDLQEELKNLLSSDIVKGKVAVRRAYADWRRYPQYIVPLTEASIDLIFAPAYGSSKKNATDIRLAIDALELVFTRPEIGTFVLLSGDSDFSSMVIKLKEYGKYVIGVGIRESSSDLLVMNCDEYYSYNALAGLVKNGEDETTRWDPWELVTESVARMKRNGDVMRSDRLKQVMQEIDASFDEKNLGHPKFSRFVQEAQQRGLLKVTKLESGQLEIDVPDGGALPERAEAKDGAAGAAPSVGVAEGAAPAETARAERDRDDRRGRRGRRGRGRDRFRDRAEGAEGGDAALAPAEGAEGALDDTVEIPALARTPAAPPVDVPLKLEPEGIKPLADDIGRSGERLTRNDAFDLVRRAVEALVIGEDATTAAAVRQKAFDLLGRDSESLAPRMFERILQDAHDANMIDLRRRGHDWEVARAADAASIVEQLKAVDEQQAAEKKAAAALLPPAPRGMGARGIGGRGKGPGAPPPELLMVGVVGAAKPAAATNGSAPAAPATPVAAPAVAAPAPAPVAAPVVEAAPAKPRKGAKAPAKAPAKKAAKAPAKAAKPAAKTEAAPAAKKAAKAPSKAAKTPAKKAAKKK
jgi:uncharacterized protein (TIGR00288 family)